MRPVEHCANPDQGGFDSVQADADHWGATELILPPGAAAGGWCLLRGQLVRRGGDYDARLHFDAGKGWSDAEVQVPTSSRGVVHQVVRIPSGVRRAALHPGRSWQREPGPVPQLARIGALRAWGWMLLRVVTQSWLQPRAKRQALGLSWKGVLANLPDAYRRVSMLRAHAAAPAYGPWIRQHDSLVDTDREQIASDIRGWTEHPFFHVVVAGTQPELLARTRASLDGQLYSRFSLSEAGPSLFDATEALPAPGSAWVMFLRAGDVLAEHALYWFAVIARGHPTDTLIFADEDQLDGEGRRGDPEFKPGWSWAHARCARFFGDAVALNAAVLARVAALGPVDVAQGNHDLVLRAMEASGRAHHIPAVLLHRGSRQAPSTAAALAAVKRHLERQGVAAEALPSADGCLRIRYALPDIGFDEIYLHHVGQGQGPFIEAFGAHVLPQLR